MIHAPCYASKKPLHGAGKPAIELSCPFDRKFPPWVPELYSYIEEC